MRGSIRGTLILGGLAACGLAFAGGCIVEQTGGGSFGSRPGISRGMEVSSDRPSSRGSGRSTGQNSGGASGTNSDQVPAITAAEVFSPLPPLSPGRGDALPVGLAAAPPRDGDVYGVDVTMIVEILIREVADPLAAVPRFNLAEMQEQSSGMFNGQTVGRLRGRLTVQRTDAAGRLLRAAFETSEAALVRDGELLARVPANRLVELSREIIDSRPAAAPGSSGSTSRAALPRLSPLSVRLDGEDLGADTRRLFQACLLNPLETERWGSELGAASLRPRRAGEAWALDRIAITDLLGLPEEAALDPRGTAQVVAGSERRAADGTPTILVEIRTRAESVIDDRIIDAFGPSLAGLPDAASVHRVRGRRGAATPPGPAEPRDHVWSSAIAHRFDLLDQRGPLEAQRLERMEVSMLWLGVAGLGRP